MTTEPKLAFISVARGEALKKIENYVSDNHKDIQPIQALRVRTDAAIATATVGIASFLIQGVTLSAMGIRAAVFVIGYGILQSADTAIAKALHKKEANIRLAEGVMAYIHESEDPRVKVPVDLPAFLETVSGDVNMPEYTPANDPVKKSLKKSFYASLFAAGILVASQANLGPAAAYLQRVMEQPALPASNQNKGHSLKRAS